MNDEEWKIRKECLIRELQATKNRLEKLQKNIENKEQKFPVTTRT